MKVWHTRSEGNNWYAHETGGGRILVRHGCKMMYAAAKAGELKMLIRRHLKQNSDYLWFDVFVIN